MGAPERPPNQRVRLALLERGRLVVAVHFLAPVGRHSWHCDTNTTVSAVDRCVVRGCVRTRKRT